MDRKTPSRIGIANLAISDLDVLCPLMEENVRQNDLQGYLRSPTNPNGPIRICALRWGQDETIPDSLLNMLPLDFILLSDCVYLEDCFDPLLETLDQLMAPQTQCLMSYKRRRRAEKQFFAKLKKKFDITEVSCFRLGTRFHRCRSRATLTTRRSPVNDYYFSKSFERPRGKKHAPLYRLVFVFIKSMGWIS